MQNVIWNQQLLVTFVDLVVLRYADAWMILEPVCFVLAVTLIFQIKLVYIVYQSSGSSEKVPSFKT